MNFSLLSLFKSSGGARGRRSPSERDSTDAQFSVGKIILSREKAAVPTYVLDGSRDPSGKVKPALVRFTRLRIVIRGVGEERHLSIAGQRTGTVLRLGAYIAKEIEKVPAFLYSNSRNPTDWAQLWKSALEATFKGYREGQWIQIYLDGILLFNAGAPLAICEALEAVAVGVDLTQELVEKASSNFVGDGAPVPARYTGQTFLAVSRSGENFRGALTDRHDNHIETLFAYAPIATEGKSSRILKLSRFTNFCADVLDGMTLRTHISGLAVLPESQREAHKQFLLDASYYQRELLGRIVAFERSQHVIFRPERPNFE